MNLQWRPLSAYSMSKLRTADLGLVSATSQLAVEYPAGAGRARPGAAESQISKYNTRNYLQISFQDALEAQLEPT